MIEIAILQITILGQMTQQNGERLYQVAQADDSFCTRKGSNVGRPSSALEEPADYRRL